MTGDLVTIDVSDTNEDDVRVPAPARLRRIVVALVAIALALAAARTATTHRNGGDAGAPTEAGGAPSVHEERNGDNAPLGDRIRPGAHLPPVAAELVRGDAGPLPIPPTRRWTLVLITAPWCERSGCDNGWDRLRTARHPGVMVLSTMADHEEAIEAFDSWPSDVSVLSVPDLGAWDIGAVPTWIVFDPRGVVADARAGPVTNLRAILASLDRNERPPQLRGE